MRCPLPRYRLRSPLEVLDPDPDDLRLDTVGERLEVWRSGDGLTFAVRSHGPAPELFGTVNETLRPSGDGIWGLRVRLPTRLLDAACLEYRLVDDTRDDANRAADRDGLWRGPTARPPAPTRPVLLSAHTVPTAADRDIAERHPLRLWSPPEPVALMICADGEGLDSWASVAAGAKLPVALVGVDSAARQVTRADLSVARDREAVRRRVVSDPRACAYLPHVDPAYFSRHMDYVTGTVVPWARAELGQLPMLVFGVSNGAVFSASAVSLHPETFVGSVAFSMGVPPLFSVRSRHAPRALAAGRLEPGFLRETTRYARRLRRRGASVRLELPVRGHDHSMWCDELPGGLAWMLGQIGC